MSVTTGFNFAAYSRDLVRETHSSKDGVALSVLSSADMRRIATVECRTWCGKEIAGQPWKSLTVASEAQPTLWDTRMGNFALKPFPVQPCATCAAVNEGFARSTSANERCMGHYGVISMPKRPLSDGTASYHFVYSPLLFEELVRLVRTQCYFCQDFRAPQLHVFRYLCAFTLLDMGLVGDALHFLQTFPASALTAASRSSTATRRARPTGDDDDVAAQEEEQPDEDEQRSDDDRMLAHQQQKPPGRENEMDRMQRYVAEAKGRAKDAGLLPKKSELADHHRTVNDIRNDLVRDAISTLGSVTRDCKRCGATSPVLAVRQGQIYAKWPAKALAANVASGYMSEEERAEIDGEMTFFARQRVRLDPYIVRSKLAHVFAQPQSCALLQKLFPHLGEPAIPELVRSDLKRDPAEAYDLFFLDCVLVPPLHLRLSQGVEVLEPSGKVTPDDCTKKLSEVLQFAHATEELMFIEKDVNSAKQLESNLFNLQLKVNEVYGRVLDGFAKKEGLFRSNMMGKRVNQACRSVISPDFTVEPNQLLLPRSFARRLSFPETVTTYSPERLAFLKRCVINGPNVYPGAIAVEIRKPGGFVDVKNLVGRSLQQKEREQLATDCFALVRPGTGYEVIIHRHVVDEDRLIFNRQPTLHKPSMMAYRARVLSGLKTIRFHYVNAKSFNADFDGDEMNVHVPQGIACRAELDTIMDSNLNYLVPTSGKPIRGLIQDHCDAGVLLAARDKFFTYEDFVQLALLGVGPYIGVGPAALKQLAFVMPVPTVLKPVKLWTGKQIFSVLFRFITMMDSTKSSSSSSEEPIGIAAKRQTTTFASAWSYRDGKVITPESFYEKLPDNPVIVQNSELVVGVLDKSQTGPTSLSIAHVVNDVFGPHHTGVFFGALGRILTYGLQKEGFSMGIDDMFMIDDAKRSEMLREIDINAFRDPVEPMAYINQQASVLQKQFFPYKQRTPFPDNQLVMMTISGAKGSPTNAVQMNLVIGQQTFDSKRIPRTLSGKTLPSFFIGDQRARSFGFAMGRFVSGIRPAEYTITAMAGRVGLIDTAIKTARSGELERCLMKGLESVRVHWGGSVRDGDGALIQTRYGGDGLDPSKASTLREFDLLHRNAKVILSSLPHAFRSETELSDDLKQIYSTIYEEARKTKSYAHTKKSDREMSQILRARLEWMRVDAGEPVGVLAAQALGEPSTQMTLNTFHSVGTTVSHVSSGIPRLRELMLHASVKSPAVFLPILSTAKGELGAVNEIKALMTPVPLSKYVASTEILSDPVSWSIARPVGTTEVYLAIAFDSLALTQHQRACAVSAASHVESFRTTLKRFATKFRGLILGRRNPFKKEESGGGGGGGGDGGDGTAAGGGRGGDDDGMGMMTGDALMAQEDVGDYVDPEEQPSDQGNGSDADDDLESRSSASPQDEGKNMQDVESAAGNEDEDEDGTSSSASGESNNSGRSSSSEDDGSSDDGRERLGHDAASLAQRQQRQQQQAADAVPNRYDSIQSIRNEKLGYSIAVASTTAGGTGGEDGPLFTVSFRFTLPVATIAVVSDLLRDTLTNTFFHSTHPQVEQISFQEASGREPAQLVFKGDGCKLRSIANVVAPYSLEHPGLAVDKLTSSDFRDVLETYGVEAAYHALFAELKELFKAYAVDFRHLSLVCDVATHHGVWKPFRFSGVAAMSSSPLYQMTVAASGKFLRSALARGTTDSLGTVSSSIMTGERPKVGTAVANVSRSSETQTSFVKERINTLLKPMAPARRS